LRILLLNQFYPPDVAATGQLLGDLAEGLVRQGHEVHVLCSRRTYAGGNREFLPEESLEGVHIHRVRATGFGRKVTAGRLIDYASFYIFAMWQAILMPRMDVSVCLTTPPFIALIGLLLRWLKGTRMVLWTMDLYPEVAVAYGYLRKTSFVRWLSSVISKNLYKGSFCIISLGEVMTERLIEAGAPPSKIVTVHNWAPGHSFSPR